MLLLSATLVGLVTMHQFAGAVGSSAHHAAAADVAVAASQHQATEPVCDHPGDCPDDTHGHPGQVCQAKPGTAAAVPPPPLVALPPIPAAASANSPATADRDARGGSGCGPPGRAALAVWRI
ncbi:DUF6153 family protein [Spirilliplanes yamanashiensis]|uniref:Secreted protein n=1 Tax=Spirilliplanes yamanashiensis TaxID=42233 RepID=A0A8J3YEP2_9ACTN|nr:DUF6153 family protein [Spirilliplanes yamanashiensis]MDP9818292.1 hypothetical protein [Spirilliplanes yamanashiensis]GIJ06709.1 hypothetical protein Sya03_60610 [Spirilliplanes yamanashiensis]